MVWAIGPRGRVVAVKTPRIEGLMQTAFSLARVAGTVPILSPMQSMRKPGKSILADGISITLRAIVTQAGGKEVVGG